MNSGDIFGGEIQYFRLEPKYWKPIIDQMVGAGLKSLTTYISWNIHQTGEPNSENPAGILDFEGKADPKLNLLKFLDIAHEADLLVNFRCGPFCCNELNFGGFPKSLMLDHPDMLVWNHKDELTQGYWITRKEGGQPSYLHPDYLAQCRYWLDAVDQIIKPRLRSAGGCIDMINLDNEVSYIVRDGFLDSDYNPVNVRPGGFWHQFLTEKYGAASSLPYGSSYDHIDQVPAPREIPEDITTDLARHLDWVEFKEWVMCRYLGELRAMHVENGVEDVIFMTNFNPHLPEGVPTRMPSFEKAVKGKGRGTTGYDFYRGTFLSWSGYSSMARVLKLMNASLDYTWSAEFMSGTWKKDLSGGTRVSDDHMRFMARCAIAQGCKSISWFMFHDRRVWGDSPVSSHGHPRPSLEVLKETRSHCIEKIPHWDKLVPQTDCCIIYDIANHRHTAVGDPLPCDDNASHIGAPLINGVQAGESSREYIGLYRMVEVGGRQAGAVDTEARPEQLTPYRLAFLPGGALISVSTAETLNQWVHAGGVLVVSGAWPTLSEHQVSITFLGLTAPDHGEYVIGEGKVIVTGWLAESEPEKEDLSVAEKIQNWCTDYAGKPAVHIQANQEVTWQDWKKGAGVDNAATKDSDELSRVETFIETRTLASAILHEGGGFPVLFVLNHFIDAVEFKVSFGTLQPEALECLDTGTRITLEGGSALVDVDRKSGKIYKVIL